MIYMSNPSPHFIFVYRLSLMLSRLFSRISCRCAIIADAEIPPLPYGVVYVPPPPPFNQLTDPSTIVVEYKQSRPYVKLRLDGVITSDKTIEVVFDTSLHHSIMYMNESLYPIPASLLAHLSPEMIGQIFVKDTATIRLVNAAISRSFLAFPITVELGNGPNPAMVGRLGAVRMSDFTSAAGLFAYSVNPDSGESATLSVRVPNYKVIEELHCESPLGWMPLSSYFHWSVPGEMQVGDTPAQPSIFAIDTANPVLSLQPGMYNTIIRLIRATGATIKTDRTRWYVSRCSELLSQFPHFNISLDGGFTAIVGPSEYIGSVRIAPDTCDLNIRKSNSRMTHLGSPFLRRTTVVFDHERGRLGMCKTAASLVTTTIAAGTSPPAVVTGVIEELPPQPSPITTGISTVVVEVDGAINPDLGNMHLQINLERFLPRVQLKLAGMMNTAEDTVEVLFDTGSTHSVIIMNDTMYPSPPLSDFVSDLLFGFAEQPKRFCVRGIANDTATLRFIGGSPFEFPVRIHLTESPDPNLGSGLLGAARDSDFTRAAGLFVYSGDAYSGQSATLLVRVPSEDLIVEHHCRSPLAWTPLLSTTSWTVAGTTEIIGPEFTVVAPTLFNIDTGSSGLNLSNEMYDELVSSIRSTGARVSPAAVLFWEEVSRCSELSSQFPSISISVGEGFTASLGPNDYLGPVIRQTNTCFLKISRWQQSVIVLGWAILRSTTVAFDQERNRLGMCTSQ